MYGEKGDGFFVKKFIKYVNFLEIVKILSKLLLLFSVKLGNDD